MNVSSIGSMATPVMAPADSVTGRDQAVKDFNVLLMEMFVRQSGLASAFAGEESPEGTILSDLMNQVLSSQLASQFHLVTAADLFGVGQNAEARINE